MQALEVKIGDWFMVNRNKKWYKKEGNGPAYVSGSVIGVKKEFLIPNSEEVMVRT